MSGVEDLCSALVSKSYVAQGFREIHCRSNLVKDLLSRRRLPDQGWDEMSIERLVSDLALMDSSNFKSNAGAGEREGRVACPMVYRRHFGLAHGIGRSGDIAAEQPKAAGSTLMTRVCHFLVADALRLAGLGEVGPVQVLPLATGMAMTVTLLSIHAARPDPSSRFVVWFRIDQKTCLKAIVSANLVPIVLEPRRDGDELGSDCDALQATLESLDPQNVCCVISTTSCFAPRACDEVEKIARICAAAGVPHLINNAYGAQSASICKQITRACRVGRVDAVVQSTDKNFMVPVGGSLLFAPSSRPELVHAVAKAYPGRASATAHLDLMLTLLYLGSKGWLAALKEREALFDYFKERMEALAAANGERLLVTPRNPISMAMTLSTLEAKPRSADMTVGTPSVPPAGSGHSLPTLNETPHCVVDDIFDPKETNVPPDSPAGMPGESPDGRDGDPGVAESGHEEVEGTTAAAPLARPGPSATFFGSMLWQRGVSGVRVVARGKQQAVAGTTFQGYGSSCNDYPVTYMTVAAALGGSREEVDTLVTRVQKCFTEFRKKLG